MTEQSPDATVGQTSEAAERTAATPESGDAAKVERTDWKREMLEKGKPAQEEANRLRARVAELEQERNRPPTPPPASADPEAIERQQLEYLASVGDPAAARTLRLERQFAREMALANARIQIAANYAAEDRDGITKRVMSGDFRSVEAAADAYYGEKYRAEKSDREKHAESEAARKRAEDEARRASEAAPATAAHTAGGSSKPSGPMMFSKWNTELAAARAAGDSARTKELLELANRNQVGEG